MGILRMVTIDTKIQRIPMPQTVWVGGVPPRKIAVTARIEQMMRPMLKICQLSGSMREE